MCSLLNTADSTFMNDTRLSIYPRRRDTLAGPLSLLHKPGIRCICLGQATESFIDLESGSELSVQKASPVPLTEELWLNSFKTLL